MYSKGCLETRRSSPLLRGVGVLQLDDGGCGRSEKARLFGRIVANSSQAATHLLRPSQHLEQDLGPLHVQHRQPIQHFDLRLHKLEVFEMNAGGVA
mmetsp:Transcript_5211/g.8012  ORF Transcript_5211/g.8012 Transcript_5211/m.8012 type:complete len:96 (-) Transcript_5211:557-844(-)